MPEYTQEKINALMSAGEFARMTPLDIAIEDKQEQAVETLRKSKGQTSKELAMQQAPNSPVRRESSTSSLVGSVRSLSDSMSGITFDPGSTADHQAQESPPNTSKKPTAHSLQNLQKGRGNE
ncbi:MAG: hypothetical protein ACJAW3_000410 [Lentimonas sp.]|jgi:hypothetical protein